MKKIWIDLDNTPHIPFFRPIIDRLSQLGYTPGITARDAYQVCALADYFHLDYQRIGRHYGKSKTMKVIGSVVRAAQLAYAMRGEKPDLAVSHGSRSQLIAAHLLGVPSIVIYDYEFANALPSLHPNLIMVPEIIPDNMLGYRSKAVYKYPGIKEDVYVPDFIPDPAIRNDLGISADSLLVTVRPPATEAHYHCHESQELYQATIDYLAQKPNVQIVLVPRNQHQEEFARSTWQNLIERKIIVIPDHAVDGLNLIWFSDLVISGGGTMNREAAALGVPVYSIFRSRIGAVDQYLANSGRLVLLEGPEDLPTKIDLSPRNKERKLSHTRNGALEGIVEKIVELAEAT